MATASSPAGRRPSAWLQRAHAAASVLPAGAPAFDPSAVTNTDAERDGHWADYLDQLRQQPGIVVTETGQHDGKFLVSGLRDPLAADPLAMLGAGEGRSLASQGRYDLDPRSSERSMTDPAGVAERANHRRRPVRRPDRWLRARHGPRRDGARMAQPGWDLSRSVRIVDRATRQAATRRARDRPRRPQHSSGSAASGSRSR